MARLVAAHLEANDITYVVDSPLVPAQETAAPIATDHRAELTPQRTKDIADFDVGTPALKPT